VEHWHKFLTVALVLILIPLVTAATAENCGTSSTYDTCYSSRYSYNYGSADAHAVAKIEVSLDNSDFMLIDGYNYYLNEYKVDYKCTGDKAYYVEGEDADGAAQECNENGCPFLELTKEGTRILKGEIEKFTFICWDYDRDDASNGDWATAWVAQPSPKFQTKIRTVECYEDANCGDDICNKDSDWNTWKCEPKPIDPCEGIVCDSKCYDDITILTKGYCEGGACKYGETTSCDDGNPLTLGDRCNQIVVPADNIIVQIAFNIGSSEEIDDTKLQAYCTWMEEVECVEDSYCDDSDPYTIRDWCENNVCMHSQKVQCIKDEDCNVEEFCDENNCRADTLIEDIEEFIEGEGLDVTTSPSVLEEYRASKNYLIAFLVILTVGLISALGYVLLKRKR